MARQKIPLEEYQTRLAKHFSYDGVVGGHLLPLGRLEEAAGAKLYSTYHGHRYLGDASQSFFVETLGAIERHLSGTAAYPCPEYPLIYIDVGLVFRRIRSAHVLSTSGYLGPALALLREVKDRSILLSSVLTGRISYSELMGIDPVKDANLAPELV